MCKIMEQKLKGASGKSKEEVPEEKDDDDDVIMNKHYKVDIIKQFLQQDTNKELIKIEDLVSPKIKKNLQVDRHEGVAREVNHKFKNI